MDSRDNGKTSSNNNSPAWVPAAISFAIPGGGQLLQGYYTRALGFFLGIVVLTGLIFWFQSTVLLAPLILIWLWNVWDAYHLAKGKINRLIIPILLGAFIIYSLGIVATEVQPRRMVTGWSSMQPYVRALFRPELLTYPTDDRVAVAPILVPCVEPLPEPDREGTEIPHLELSSPCGDIGQAIRVEGQGFFPNFTGEFWWINPIGDPQRVTENGKQATFITDSLGRFTATIDVPLAVPVSNMPAEGETQTHLIRAEQHKPYGSLTPTETLALVLEKIGETIALAFLATVLGVVFAVPVSFLAARNLMYGNRFTRAIYYVVRTILNITRSIETLMWAIIFAVWVGLGPFGGMLALWLHTVAALGKLYSESIESIDPGPIEAVRATGANGAQVIVYAVLPQVLPSFASYTLFRWDINVRMSTVIGLVSDAGLGFLVIQWIRLNNFSAMATAILAIVLVVVTLDFISGILRKRIIEGNPSTKQASPLRRVLVRGTLIIGFIIAFAWSWNVAQVDMRAFVLGVPDGLRMARAFAVPHIFERPTEEFNVSQTLPVPCGASETEPQTASGQRVNLAPTCGDAGDPITIIGSDLPPDHDVSIRWVFPDGAFLRVKSNCCTTNAEGRVQLDATISPLMETAEGDEVGSVSIVWKETAGRPQISDTAKTVVELSLVTLLMALLATTMGAFVAIPLSFLGARNIMGDSWLGRTVYTISRVTFSVLRSIEPMILVLICAAWVGAGPFAGVIALTLNNIPNLAKLFSERIEEIEEGPVEAVTATGANRLQVLVYSIVPQLVPPFLAFILYQWDINIRMSTVIGFVGGGGIGQQFRLWVGLNQYDKAGTAVWAIVFMVWTMDYISAKARERLV